MWFAFTFLLCNLTIWLYVSNPHFYDGFPGMIVGCLILSGIMGGLVLLALLNLTALIPRIKAVVQSRKRLIKSTGITVSLIWLLIPAALCIISSRQQTIRLANPPKLIVIGVDAAIWDLLNPWMEQGKLPHLQSVKAKGVSSTLRSMDPMRSPSLWTSICTGVSPERHGINGFFSTRADLKTPRIWDIMTANGLSVGLFNWLLTNPPESKFAFCIPAWLAATAETHPMQYHFLQELNLDQELGGGRLDVSEALTQAALNGVRVKSLENMTRFYLQDFFGLDDEARLARKMLAEVPMQTDVFLHLLQQHQPDVAAITFYGSDKLAHRFWHYMQPKAFSNHDYQHKPEYESVIEHYYIQTDQAIGRILDAISNETTVVLLSDHGMKADPAMPRQFFLDPSALLNLMNLESLFRHQTIMRRTVLKPAMDDILLLQETQSALQSFRFPNGDTVFRVIIEDGKIVLRTNFSLTWNDGSPLLTEDHIQYAGQIIPIEELFFSRTFSGTHDLNGVLMMQGPHIKQEVSISPPHLLDVAPTLLFMMNQPISKTLEGTVIKEAFQPGWWTTQTVQLVDSYEQIPYKISAPKTNQALLERLRSMGYVE